eukprot:scaffold27237_cov83-Phaeocystis_antarctica.AAC.1
MLFANPVRLTQFTCCAAAPCTSLLTSPAGRNCCAVPCTAIRTRGPSSCSIARLWLRRSRPCVRTARRFLLSFSCDTKKASASSTLSTCRRIVRAVNAAGRGWPTTHTATRGAPTVGAVGIRWLDRPVMVAPRTACLRQHSDQHSVRSSTAGLQECGLAHEQSQAEDEGELTNRAAAGPEPELEPGAPEPETPKTK